MPISVRIMNNIEKKNQSHFFGKNSKCAVEIFEFYILVTLCCGSQVFAMLFLKLELDFHSSLSFRLLTFSMYSCSVSALAIALSLASTFCFVVAVKNTLVQFEFDFYFSIH